MSSEDYLQSRLNLLSRLLNRKIDLREPPQEEKDHDAETKQDLTTVSAQDTRAQISGVEAPAPAEDESCNRAEQVLDYSSFQVDEPIDQNVAFCPWNLVVAYPSRYIGKTNKPLAQPFFDKILEGRVWDFFYIHDVSNPLEKPFLLVPTVQFEDFLCFINKVLGISLHVPLGASEAKFLLKFGDGGTPRPRYLQRSRDCKTLKIENWPLMKEEDVVAFKYAPAARQADWTNTFKQIPTSVVYGKRIDAKQKAARRAQDRARMLSDAQQFLGLCKEGVVEDVVFVCCDIEAIERAPNPISEIGIAILDIEDIKGISPGLYGENWFPMIQAYHLRIKEYSGLVNKEFVHGCPDAFDFGSSTFPRKVDAPEAIMSILDPLIKANRSLVIVGHDVGQDVGYLSEMGVEITKLPGMRGTLDSQTMHQAWRKEDRRSLRDVLADLGMASKHLHNAGNDAVYTLRAVVGIAVRQTCEGVVEEPKVETPVFSGA